MNGIEDIPQFVAQNLPAIYQWGRPFLEEVGKRVENKAVGLVGDVTEKALNGLWNKLSESIRGKAERGEVLSDADRAEVADATAAVIAEHPDSLDGFREIYQVHIGGDQRTVVSTGQIGGMTAETIVKEEGISGEAALHAIREDSRAVGRLEQSLADETTARQAAEDLVAERDRTIADLNRTVERLSAETRTREPEAPPRDSLTGALADSLHALAAVLEAEADPLSGNRMGRDDRAILADLIDLLLDALGGHTGPWTEADALDLWSFQRFIADRVSGHAGDDDGPADEGDRALGRLIAIVADLVRRIGDLGHGGNVVRLDNALRHALVGLQTEAERVLADTPSDVPPQTVRHLKRLVLFVRQVLSADELHLGDFKVHGNAVRAASTGAVLARVNRLAAVVMGVRADLAPPGAVFVEADADRAPEMVVLPGCPEGFRMGLDPEMENSPFGWEFPRHRVTIRHRLAVGRYPVTVAQWRAFEADSGADPIELAEELDTPDLPMVMVSWDDTRLFIGWLNDRCGFSDDDPTRYRMLSEAEWEYVARAGSETRYAWGDEIGTNNANCRGSGSKWSGESMSPVGRFAPNSFGLYDMHGNVWEWVEDCWHDNYSNAPKDGSAWVAGGDSHQRVLRGGSWVDIPSNLCSAIRFREPSGFRDDVYGFRICRTVSR